VELNQYLGLFIDESKENLQRLNECLLKLEEDSDNLELLNDIFRVAHTLKGMSKTMGFNNLADLTHNMENLLEPLRNGSLKPTGKIVDVLFKCLDSLEMLVDKIAVNSEEDKNDDVSELVKDLQLFLSQPVEDSKSKVQQEVTFNQYEKTVIEAAIANGMIVKEINVAVSSSCMLAGARAYMVVKALESFGELIKSYPDIENLENGEFDKTFKLFITTSADDKELNEALNKISELDEIVISNVSVEDKLEEESAEKTDDKTAEVKQPAAEETAQVQKAKPVSQTIRVSTERMDKLMDLVGEMVISKTRISQISHDTKMLELNESVGMMEGIVTEIQEIVMKLRLVPIEQVFNRFPRLVRDLSKNLKKEINLVITGQETEIDRMIVDEIGDPLVHIIRNSIDHGIESPEERIKAGKPAKGTIELEAFTEGDNVIVRVTDDGKGINTERLKESVLKKGLMPQSSLNSLTEQEIINLIFLAGMSTAENVTDISGRGVGMDVVKSRIASLNGGVSVVSELGKGTSITILLPSTMSIIQSLLVKVGEEIYAAPLNSISEIIDIPADEIRKVQNNEVIVLRGHTLPLVRMNRILDIADDETNEDSNLTVIIVKSKGSFFGVVVSELIGQQEIVIKPINRKLCSHDYISGATTLGNGRVALIINLNSLLRNKLEGIYEYA